MVEGCSRTTLAELVKEVRGATASPAPTQLRIGRLVKGTFSQAGERHVLLPEVGIRLKTANETGGSRSQEGLNTEKVRAQAGFFTLKELLQYLAA